MNYIFSFGFVILTALSTVLIHNAADSVAPAFNLFLGTLIAIIFFHLVNFNAIKAVYIKAWNQKILWVKIMLSVGVMWLATIFGPAMIDPNMFILLYFSMVCVLGIFNTIKKNFEINFLICGIGVIICASLIVMIHLHEAILSSKILLGIGLGLLGGMFNFIYSLQSFQFIQKTQLSVTQVLAIRFWLVELLCLPLIPPNAPFELNLHASLYIVAIAFSSLILPIYLNLKSIATIGPEKSAIIFGLIPLTTYLMQIFFMAHFEWKILLLNVLIGFFIGLPYFIRLSHQTNRLS